MSQERAMLWQPVAVAAALCLMMVASGIWHNADQSPSVLLDDRDIFIKAEAAQQLQDYVNAFGGKPAKKASQVNHHAKHEIAHLEKETAEVLPEGHRFLSNPAQKSTNLLKHWASVNDVVFPKRWAHAKPAHHASRKRQESQEMSSIRKVNAETIPAVHLPRATHTTSSAMLKHYNHLFDSTFKDLTHTKAVSKPSSQSELDDLKDLNDAIFPKQEKDSKSHWTATKQGLLAHYKQLSDAAFPTEHFSHHAPLSGDEELARDKSLSASVNPGETPQHARKKRVGHADAANAELAHLKALTSRVFPAGDSSRQGSRQTARDSEAAELAGFKSVNSAVFPAAEGRRRARRAESSADELAALHRLSDSVVPTETETATHSRQSARDELAAGMQMSAGREIAARRKHALAARNLKARGVKGVAVGSQLHAQPQRSGLPWHRRAPAGAEVEGAKRNIV